jgi:hypothetical protein
MSSNAKAMSVTFIIPNNMGLNYNSNKTLRAAHKMLLLTFAIGVFGRHDNHLSRIIFGMFLLYSQFSNRLNFMVIHAVPIFIVDVNDKNKFPSPSF